MLKLKVAKQILLKLLAKNFQLKVAEPMLLKFVNAAKQTLLLFNLKLNVVGQMVKLKMNKTDAKTT